MEIAIFGVGAMGSVYAGLMAEAGHEIWAVELDKQLGIPTPYNEVLTAVIRQREATF
jgi:ketopantoate reductase